MESGWANTTVGKMITGVQNANLKRYIKRVDRMTKPCLNTAPTAVRKWMVISMYDELIEQLRYMAKIYSICENENTNEYKLSLQAADAIEDLQGKTKILEKIADIWCDAVPKWIHVTERLPDNQFNVLCDDEGGVVVGYYTDEEVGWHDMHCYKIYPTHWMPLPEPPESEGE